jgi:hypothetical protein
MLKYNSIPFLVKKEMKKYYEVIPYETKYFGSVKEACASLLMVFFIYILVISYGYEIFIK